jgi:RHS repeat-associated protein
MGYYYNTEPENAWPPNLCASPKTHVPDPRLQKRGYRYYLPETGRWVSRDPVAEQGGLNICVFAGNNSIVQVDPFGLKWYGVSYKSTITIQADGFVAAMNATSGANANCTSAIFWENNNQPPDTSLNWGAKGHIVTNNICR